MGQTSPQARARPRRLGREAGGSLSCVREPRPSTPPSLKIRSRVQQAPNAESVRIKRSGVQAASVHRCRAEPRRSAGAGARRGEGGAPSPPGRLRVPPPPHPTHAPPGRGGDRVSLGIRTEIQLELFRKRARGGVAPTDGMGLAAAAAAALALVGGGDAARSPGGARAGASPVGVRPPPHPLPLSSPTLHAPDPSREARCDFLG